MEMAGKLWSASATSPYVQDLSHWRGARGWSDEAWEALGRTQFAMFEELCQMAGIKRPVESVLEWGAGGGANAVHFCNEVRLYYDVDISAANLAQCERELQARGFKGFRPILIDVADPAGCLPAIAAPVEVELVADDRARRRPKPTPSSRSAPPIRALMT